MKTIEIDAVHKQNLMELLDKLGLRGQLTRGELFCTFCSGRITFDSISCIRTQGQRVEMVCDKLGCYEKALSSNQKWSES